eukprot:Lithocolla_globosa_v1_NODE_108_length_6291_cov_39.629250.p2 type:complete len:155 gc:universal NODE_108_length_6291_cov_39.629250:4233-3769(-)
MKKYKKKGFKGTYAIDMLDSIPINKKDKQFSFVMNTSPIKIKDGHWVGVYVNGENVEYYDSFGEEYPHKFLKRMKKLLKKWKPDNVYQIKVNRVKKQKVNTDTCGYHAMNFITKRYNGESFMDATDFKIIKDSIKGEKEIKKFKEMVNEFEYLK